MKKILMIAYYFPPLGMGGAQRPAKFAKYLPDFGWEPTVVTVKPVAYWAEDRQLLEELESIRIVRTGSMDPQRLSAKWLSLTTRRGSQASQSSLLTRVNKSVLSIFLIPDTKVLWRPFVYRTGSRLIQQNRYDAIFTTSPPNSIHLTGKKLARRYDVKWIADFRDSWAGGVVVREPTAFHKRINRLLEKSVVEEAHAVVSASHGIQEKFREFHELLDDKLHIIPNGFDPSDFPTPSRHGNNGRYTFCHCGSITEFSNPEPLIMALQYLVDTLPDVKDKLLFQFVGYDATGSFEEQVERAQLNEIIQIVGYQSHQKALQYLVNADALILIAQGPTGATFIPGKSYEYLGARKPILLISNVEDTLNLLKESQATIARLPEDYKGISEAILDLLNGHCALDLQDTFSQQFHRKILTGKLASILDNLRNSS